MRKLQVCLFAGALMAASVCLGQEPGPASPTGLTPAQWSLFLSLAANAFGVLADIFRPYLMQSPKIAVVVNFVAGNWRTVFKLMLGTGAALLVLLGTSSAAHAQTATAMVTSCAKAQPVQGPGVPVLTALTYQRVSSGHYVLKPDVAFGGAYSVGVGLLPDASCLPRIQLLASLMTTVGLSGSASGDASLRLTPALTIGVRLTGVLFATLGAGVDAVNAGSGNSGFLTSFTSPANVHYFGGLVAHWT